MFELVDRRLDEWIHATLGDVVVTFEPPARGRPGMGVSCYLLEVADDPPLRGAGRAPLKLALRYLITAWAETPGEAHRLLGTLAFATLEHSEYRLDLSKMPPDLWSALEVPPTPALLLRAPVMKERPEPVTPLVRQPLEISAAPMAPLHGLVMGPGETPLAGARVEAPSLGLYVATDRKGQFAFAAIPVLPEGIELVVSARGRRQAARVSGATSAHDPFVFRFQIPDPEEG